MKRTVQFNHTRPAAAGAFRNPSGALLSASRRSSPTFFTRAFLAACALVALLALTCALPAEADEGTSSLDESVRVGVVEQEGYVMPDDEGYEHGFDAEYTYKIAQYAGFNVDFVTYDNYGDLLDDLAAHKIQMSVGVSKTPEREQRFLFAQSWLARGTLSLCARIDDDTFSYGDIAAIATARIGAVRGSSMIEAVEEWADDNEIDPRVVIYPTEEELADAMQSGEVDLIPLTGNQVTNYQVVTLVSTTAYYPVFNKDEVKLCNRVDAAMNRILYEDATYAEKLLEKYEGVDQQLDISLTTSEKQWCAEHPTVRVAVIPDDMPYYAVDADGEARGIICDLYEQLAPICGLNFVFVEFATRENAKDAVMSGDADMLAITGEDVISATKQGLLLTKAYTSLGLSRIVKTDDIDTPRAAISANDFGSLSYMIEEIEADYALQSYEDLDACFKALEAGQADCIICDTAQATWLMNQHRSDAYSTVNLAGASLTLSGAVSSDNADLGSILSKAMQNSTGMMSAIIAANSRRDPGLVTLLQTIPSQWIVLFFVILLFVIMIVAFSIVRSVRQGQRANLAIAQAEVDAARQAHEAESAFLSSMSHDMRTPLNGILGFTDLALRDTDPARRQSYLEKIDSSGKLMLDLVNDVLDLSKIESGKMDMRPEPFSLVALYNAVCSSIDMLAQRQGVGFSASSDMRDDLWVNADKLRVQQIFLNLLSNAVKYTPKGGNVRWTINVEELDEMSCKISTCIEDNGIGMSEQFQKHMYDAFAQERSAKCSEVEGTGLGLSIVKRIIDLMHGSITARSALGKGTRFDVEFCVALSEAPAEVYTEAKADSQADLESIVGMRVLLAEDNTINAQLAITMLEELGITDVTLAKNGKECVDAFKAGGAYGYDVVLMDVRMPVMDGYEATRVIRTLDRADAATVPIIAMTADAYVEDVQHSREAGMDAHLAKPFDKNMLISCLVQARKCSPAPRRSA